MIRIQVNHEMFAYDMYHILKAFFPGEKILQSMDTASEQCVKIEIENQQFAIRQEELRDLALMKFIPRPSSVLK